MSGNTFAIATVLASRAGRVMVSDLAKIRAIAEAKVKTDKVDAEIFDAAAGRGLAALGLVAGCTDSQVLRWAQRVWQRTQLKKTRCMRSRTAI